ncbi:glycoside hydrolase superfamily [Mycena sp. CBHHK59/15]|nr:glycoside hydrolase superfamily [Mycena sp. CBHHK59/15]
MTFFQSCQNSTFLGTAVLDCSALSRAISHCQQNGILVALSLGGGASTVGFSDNSEATEFAHTIWDLFLGDESETRPFGSAILDG